VANEVIQAFKDNEDHRILKVHLFDDSINRHGWVIDRELAASLAEEYAQGAPYLIPPDLNHPKRPYPPFPERPFDDIQDIMRFAARYKAGECFKTELCASAHSAFGYDGYIKLTDPKAIEAFDKGLIPKYSSIALYNLSDRYPNINKAKALNICAVQIPAYPNAELLGACKGDESTCHTNLKNAGIDSSNTNKNDYCILKTLENSDYEKFKANTSLNSEKEIVASYSTMSATQTTQPVNNNTSTNQSNPAAANVQPTNVSNNPVVPQTGVTNVQQSQPLQPQTTQTEEIKKSPEDKEAKEQIGEILDYKKLYEELLPQSEHKDALLVELQKRINRYEKDQDALKIKEIERYVTIDLFNGDTKAHAQKLKEWKERAEAMTLDDLAWHLTESYGRKVFGEKKAGLNYEPTAVLSNSPQQPQNQKKFSIYEIGSLDLTKGGSY
jgi:hypothetical protein